MCLPFRFLFRAGFLALASPFGGLHAQTTWYVDAGAAPPGLGTQAAPYASLQFAIDRPTTVSGDTLLVAPGTYAERISLVKEITVRSAAGPARTRIVEPAGPGTVLVFMGPQDQYRADTERLVGFTLKGSARTSSVVNLQAGSLDHCIVTGSDGLGVSSLFGTLRHCTIADNATGIFFATFGETTLENSIVWGNGTDIQGVGGFGTARYTTFGTNPSGFMATAGPGNESADPRFVALELGDFSLSADSPCIDTADPFSPPDMDGSRGDRGALPHRPQKLRRL